MNLYNKYAPQDLTNMVGQDLILKIINGLLDDLPGSIVVSGTFGTGKTLLLTLLARRINCLNSKDLSRCNNCTNCLGDFSQDIIEIDGATHSGVDNIRKIIECVNYMPIYLKYKVYIIDEAHMLSQSAFDALLLTLHELPNNVKFFFATTKLHKIPQTILSRCLLLNLQRISNETLKSHIKTILIKENKELPEESIDLIVCSSQGSMRQALSNLQLGLLMGNDSNSLGQYLKIINPEGCLQLFIKILDGETQMALDLWNEYYKSGMDEKFFMEEITNIITNLTKARLGLKVQEKYKIIMDQYDLSSQLLCTYWDIVSTQMEGLYNNNKNIIEFTLIMLSIVMERSSLTKYLK